MHVSLEVVEKGAERALFRAQQIQGQSPSFLIFKKVINVSPGIIIKNINRTRVKLLALCPNHSQHAINYN